jgi:deazaflavin-dependent oxidoreductase (nitroreductase family)
MARNPLVRLPKPFIRGFSALHSAVVRATRGRLGAKFRGQPMILLTTTGRKSGRPRTQPLVGLPHDGSWVVAASYGGHDAHPAWYLNLQADATARVHDGKRDVPVRARDATEAERAQQYPRFIEMLGAYAAYEEATERRIPVVFLEPIGPGGGGATR